MWTQSLFTFAAQQNWLMLLNAAPFHNKYKWKQFLWSHFRLNFFVLFVPFNEVSQQPTTQPFGSRKNFTHIHLYCEHFYSLIQPNTLFIIYIIFEIYTYVVLWRRNIKGNKKKKMKKGLLFETPENNNAMCFVSYSRDDLHFSLENIWKKERKSGIQVDAALMKILFFFVLFMLPLVRLHSLILTNTFPHTH